MIIDRRSFAEAQTQEPIINFHSTSSSSSVGSCRMDQVRCISLLLLLSPLLRQVPSLLHPRTASIRTTSLSRDRRRARKPSVPLASIEKIKLRGEEERLATRSRYMSLAFSLSSAYYDGQHDDGDLQSLMQLRDVLAPSKSCKVDQMSSTDLAYIGDVVYELMVRSKSVWPPKRTSDLQNEVVNLVRGTCILSNCSRMLRIQKPNGSFERLVGPIFF